MVRILTFAFAAIALAGTTAALADNARPPAPASSFAPQPSSGPHVYGAPIGPATVGRGANAQRKHASPKHASPKHTAKTTAPPARAAKPKPRPQPVYAEPVSN